MASLADDWLLGRFVGCHWQVGWQASGLAGWLAGYLVGWFADWPDRVGCVAGWPNDWLPGWWGGWLLGQLVGWSFGSLVGWMTPLAKQSRQLMVMWAAW